ncbi:hypothetical protein BJ508DRAFT_411555 [Ascobolus immersus RN42]|uniref:Uncharacterized protein n=1 Tax=Ascobolus immersus RN42 TaxID=1160509 RepID=A0A3N4IJB4_ASCIM|nr:hypothetical protein BJ508DRAFT_411555 [Ascobolus immersus RN42]
MIAAAKKIIENCNDGGYVDGMQELADTLLGPRRIVEVYRTPGTETFVDQDLVMKTDVGTFTTTNTSVEDVREALGDTANVVVGAELKPGEEQRAVLGAYTAGWHEAAMQGVVKEERIEDRLLDAEIREAKAAAARKAYDAAIEKWQSQVAGGDEDLTFGDYADGQGLLDGHIEEEEKVDDGKDVKDVPTKAEGGKKGRKTIRRKKVKATPAPV